VTSDPDPPSGGEGDVLGSPHDDGPGALSRLPRIWRLLGIAGLVGLAALVVQGPRGTDSAPGPAQTSPNRPPIPRTAAPPPEVRGDLAGDTGFVAAVLRRVRTEHVDADRVLFAGRLPGGARVAFVGRDRDEESGVRALDVYALRIPPGGSVQGSAVTVLGRGLIESSGLLAADPVRAPTAPCRWSC
jgi:hypothetical protein